MTLTLGLSVGSRARNCSSALERTCATQHILIKGTHNKRR